MVFRLGVGVGSSIMARGQGEGRRSLQLRNIKRGGCSRSIWAGQLFYECGKSVLRIVNGIVGYGKFISCVKVSVCLIGSCVP